jgi:hypothetical protein
MRLFIYLAFLIAVLHIGFTLLGVPMYPTIGVLTVAKRNPILRYINSIVYAVLIISSFQVFDRLWMLNIVWRWETDSPSIPQAPFALLMVALQTLCLVILVLPSSSKFFKKES